MRILFVFAWLAGGEEETELRLLARTLDPHRYRIDAVACRQLDDAADPTHLDLQALGVAVDTTPYTLGFDDTVSFLARKLTGYEIVVSSQSPPDLAPALDRLLHRPPVIEHARSIAELLATPRHLVTRSVGQTEAIQAAAAALMPDRPDRTHFIPAPVDMSAFHLIRRNGIRHEVGLPPDALVIGWHGPQDANLRARHPQARILSLAPTTTEGVIAAPATIPLPDLLCAMDLLVLPTPEDATPHLIASAGAARLPVVVPSGTSTATLDQLMQDRDLRLRLGHAHYAHIAATQAGDVIARQWEALFTEVLSETAAKQPTLFRSFVQGGFEASSQRLGNGRRVDVIAATGHDQHAETDYRQLAGLGLRTVRDGLRWHLVEPQPGRFDLSSFLPMAEASQRSGTQVIWDLMHYGWPEDLDIWSPAFVDRFAALARAAAQAWRETTDAVPFWCPVNEISFFSWGGGDVGYLNPFARGRGFELKVQLARASIAAMHALREVDPRARLVHCEPLISILPNPGLDRPDAEAVAYHQSQYQACDMLTGRMWPQLGGDPSLLDIVGVNYYKNNQWLHGGPPIDVDHPSYRPLSDLMFEVYARYGRPIFVSETGIEDHRRASWFRYVTSEVARARQRGVPVEGICLYPVMNHPGWDDDRNCQNGLLTQHFEGSRRGMDADLAVAVAEAVARWPSSHPVTAASSPRAMIPARRSASRHAPQMKAEPLQDSHGSPTK